MPYRASLQMPSNSRNLNKIVHNKMSEIFKKYFQLQGRGHYEQKWLTNISMSARTRGECVHNYQV